MRVESMTSENLSDYRRFAESDEAENCGRTCYHGLIAYSEERAVGAIFWKVIRDEFDEIEEEIVFFEADSDECARALLEVHDIKIKDEGVISSYFETDEAADNVSSALINAGFINEEEKSRDIIVSLGDLKNAHIPPVEMTENIVSLRDVSGKDFWNGTSFVLYNRTPGIMEDLENLPKDYFDNDVSACMYAGKWIAGMFLVHTLPSGILLPSLLFCTGKGKDKNAIRMFCHAMDEALKKYPDDTRVIIRRHDDRSRKIADFLFPGKKGRSITLFDRMLN